MLFLNYSFHPIKQFALKAPVFVKLKLEKNYIRCRDSADGLRGQYIKFDGFSEIPCCNKALWKEKQKKRTVIRSSSKLLMTLPMKETREIICSTLVRSTKDGSYRIIRNLKSHVQYIHFKMDTLQNVITLMTLRCLTSSVNLKDAFYSVPIVLSHQKYLKFEWYGELYKSTCFPYGLAMSSP